MLELEQPLTKLDKFREEMTLQIKETEQTQRVVEIQKKEIQALRAQNKQLQNQVTQATNNYDLMQGINQQLQIENKYLQEFYNDSELYKNALNYQERV